MLTILKFLAAWSILSLVGSMAMAYHYAKYHDAPAVLMFAGVTLLASLVSALTAGNLAYRV